MNISLRLRVPNHNNPSADESCSTYQIKIISKWISCITTESIEGSSWVVENLNSHPTEKLLTWSRSLQPHSVSIQEFNTSPIIYFVVMECNKEACAPISFGLCDCSSFVLQGGDVQTTTTLTGGVQLSAVVSTSSPLYSTSETIPLEPVMLRLHGYII